MLTFCPFDNSAGVGAFVIGLSQISSFFSLFLYFHLWRYFGITFIQSLLFFIWFGITDEDAIPEISTWAILLSQFDYKIVCLSNSVLNSFFLNSSPYELNNRLTMSMYIITSTFCGCPVVVMIRAFLSFAFPTHIEQRLCNVTVHNDIDLLYGTVVLVSFVVMFYSFFFSFPT